MNNLNRQPATQQYLNWNNVKKEIYRNTINENNFEKVKSREEIDADLGKYAKRLAEFNEPVEIGIKNSEMHEYSVLKGIDELDWFEEQARGRQELPISAILTSKFDDTHNHVDLLCYPRNMKTGKITPFALDATYAIGGEDRALKKIDWTSNDRNHFHGVAKVDYCQIKGINGRKDILRKEPIIMPRFVVGYDLKFTESIIKTATIDKNLIDYYNSDTEDIEKNEDLLNATKAKWCVLRELEHQSKMLMDYLEPKMSTNEDARRMHMYASFLSRYFDGAIQFAKENDPKSAQDYVDKDPVYQNIMSLRYTE